MGLFRFLPIGLGVLLSFVGLKMLGHHYLTEIGFGTLSSLGVIVGILATSIIFSLIFPAQKEVKE
jgi:tellurite resistance protein TerC